MRNIGVVTSSRADYSILEPLLKHLEQDSSIDMNLFVTGAHFEKQYGHTYSHIQGQFRKIHQVPINMSQTNSSGIALTLANVQTEFEKCLKNCKPDILIVLGDRVELIPIALSANLLHIPIAHIHGGELTYGAIDESVRHALTKFSHLHFTSCEDYRKRVIQLGESPDRVFNVGSLALEEIFKTKFLSKAELEKELNVQLGEKNFVITLHPETIENEDYQVQMVQNVLLCLAELPRSYFLLFTATNSDLYGNFINNRIKEFVSTHPNSKYVESLGAKKYYSVLKNFDACIGNSSSGIIEAPSFGMATLNIGRRQAGRVRAKSVFDIPNQLQDMRAGLAKIIDQKIENPQNPYFKAGTAEAILNVLKSVDPKGLLNKQFFDLNMGEIQ